MSILVGEILGLCADLSSTFFAVVGEPIFVAFNTEGMLIFENVARPGKVPVALITQELILTHLGLMCVTRIDFRIATHRSTVVSVAIAIDNLKMEMLLINWRWNSRYLSLCASINKSIVFISDYRDTSRARSERRTTATYCFLLVFHRGSALLRECKPDGSESSSMGVWQQLTTTNKSHTRTHVDSLVRMAGREKREREQGWLFSFRLVEFICSFSLTR